MISNYRERKTEGEDRVSNIRYKVMEFKRFDLFLEGGES
jgi:hypothetical protein